MLSLLPIRHYERALDLGCGLGSFTRRLGDYAEQVLGIDLSHVAITEARQQTTEVTNVQFQQGDLLNLRTDVGEGFDLVVLADTLYYLSPISNDVLETVRERVARLLVPGGILLLTDHFVSTGSRQPVEPENPSMLSHRHWSHPPPRKPPSLLSRQRT